MDDDEWENTKKDFKKSKISPIHFDRIQHLNSFSFLRLGSFSSFQQK
jgi:hypothetical protein